MNVRFEFVSDQIAKLRRRNRAPRLAVHFGSELVATFASPQVQRVYRAGQPVMKRDRVLPLPAPFDARRFSGVCGKSVALASRYALRAALL